jgi:hypothetical protein
MSQLALRKKYFWITEIGESKLHSNREDARCSSVISERRPFGIEGYRVPNTSRAFFEKPRAFKIVEGKNEESYLTYAIREKKGIPSPVLY